MDSHVILIATDKSWIVHPCLAMLGDGRQFSKTVLYIYILYGPTMGVSIYIYIDTHYEDFHYGTDDHKPHTLQCFDPATYELI